MSHAGFEGRPMIASSFHFEAGMYEEIISRANGSTDEKPD